MEDLRLCSSQSQEFHVEEKEAVVADDFFSGFQQEFLQEIFPFQVLNTARRMRRLLSKQTPEELEFHLNHLKILFLKLN